MYLQYKKGTTYILSLLHILRICTYVRMCVYVNMHAPGTYIHILSCSAEGADNTYVVSFSFSFPGFSPSSSAYFSWDCLSTWPHSFQLKILSVSGDAEIHTCTLFEVQWNLSTEDTIGTQLAVLYTVEPLY